MGNYMFLWKLSFNAKIFYTYGEFTTFYFYLFGVYDFLFVSDFFMFWVLLFIFRIISV